MSIISRRFPHHLSKFVVSAISRVRRVSWSGAEGRAVYSTRAKIALRANFDRCSGHFLFLLVTILLSLPLLSQTFVPPKATGYVTDPDRILRSEQHRTITHYSTVIDDRSGVQIAVAVLPNIGDFTIDEYANRLVEAWGIGDANDDTGILILFALSERQARIEVGYGLEGIINDAKAGELLDTHLIQAKNNRVDLAVYYIYSDVAEIIAEAYDIPLTRTTNVTKQHRDDQPLRPLTLGEKIIAGIIITIVIIALIISPTFRSIVFWILINVIFNRRSRSGTGSFGGSGFGGFGGGMSGGGGAGRGW